MSDEFECQKHSIGEIIDVNGDGSVMKEVLVAGTGDENPQAGVEVNVNYVGRLHDTKEQFDANDGFVFTSNSGVIQGWQDVIRTMVIGEKSRVVIQSEKGYGAAGAGAAIPPNATLEFDIELVSFSNSKDLHGDGSVMYKTLKSDQGEWMRPENLTSCDIDLRVTSKNATTGDVEELLNASYDSFVIDAENELNLSLPFAVEGLLKAMTKGQAVKAEVLPSAGYDKASPHFGRVLTVYLTLKDFKSAPKFWELDGADAKVKRGAELKTLGNASFAKGTVDSLARACRRYQEAISGLEYIASDSQLGAGVKKDAQDVCNACRLNASVALLKLGEADKALGYAREAVKANSSLAKAWFRQGQALMALKEYREAEQSFYRASTLEGGKDDAGVLAELKKAKLAVKAEDDKERKKFKGLFTKLKGFASDDRQVANKERGAFSEEDMDGDMDDMDDIPDLVDASEDEEEKQKEEMETEAPAPAAEAEAAPEAEPSSN